MLASQHLRFTNCLLTSVSLKDRPKPSAVTRRSLPIRQRPALYVGTAAKQPLS